MTQRPGSGYQKRAGQNPGGGQGKTEKRHRGIQGHGGQAERDDEYTVAAWLRTWYELYAKPNVRTATANRYELIIEQYTVPRIGNIKLKKLTTRHLQKLYKELLEAAEYMLEKVKTTA